jgi:hypothetical protein
MRLSIHHNIVVFCIALIRTFCDKTARSNVFLIYRGEREVVACWEPSFEEVGGEGGGCEGGSVEGDCYGAGGGEDVDAAEGVFWVDVDGGFFF